MNVAVMKTKAETALTENFAGAAKSLPGGANVKVARAEAIGRFAANGLPHRRIEEWKYTDLRGMMKDALPLAVMVKSTPAKILNNDAWVRVEGIFSIETSNGKQVTSIAADVIQSIPQPPPEKRYLFF